MSKKRFILLSYFISLLFIFAGTVNAVSSFKANVNGDMVTLSASYVAKFQYSVNGGAKYDVCTGLGDDSGTDSCQISVKNGTYTFYAVSSRMADGIPSKTIQNKVITSSCSDQSKTGQTGSGTVERCFIIDANGSYKAASSATVASCASGYTLKLDVAPNGNGCQGVAVQAGKLRYCKVVFAYSCTKAQVDQSYGLLTGLSVTGYNLSPAFAQTTFNYTVNVPADVNSVSINANAVSGHTFENGYGPRTVTLGAGSTTHYIKVAGPGGTNPYAITFVKPTSGGQTGPSNPGGGGGQTPATPKDTDNTLKRITVDKGELTPAFSPTVNYYDVEVEGDVEKIGVGADLNSSKATFVEGYAPRNVDLNPGVNKITLKVRSEAGVLNVYTINVNRKGGSSCNLPAEEMPYLKDILIGDQTEDDMEEEELENLRPGVQVPDFAPEEFNYTFDIPYEYEDLPVEALVQTEGDTVEVEGNKNLEVNEEREIKIRVTDKECPDTVIEYTLNVTRLPSEILSSKIVVEDINIESKKYKKEFYDIDFEQSKKNYYITVNKGETGLKFEVETGENGETVKVIEPDKFGKGASYTIKVTSADGSDVAEYTIKISKVKSGASSILLIILIILIVLVLIYVVLRLMGYRIYFNPAMLGAMFRGNGKDKFDK